MLAERAPPLVTHGAPLFPAAEFAKTIDPALTVVVPVKVLVPDNVFAPPAAISPPVPEILPESVSPVPVSP